MNNRCECCGARWGMGDNQWISVVDRLPIKSSFVLASSQEPPCLFLAYFIDGEWYYKEGAFTSMKPTHWMPLPLLPKLEDE